jgi:hypothetical protein
MCETGKVCCYSGLSGNCVEPGACTSTVRFACQGPSACAAGEACCASVPFDQPIDASTLLSEGGLAGAGVTATSVCSSTCSAPNLSFCRSAADCAGGGSCHALPEGNPILLVLGGETFGACAALEGGTAGDAAFGGNDSGDATSNGPTSD